MHGATLNLITTYAPRAKKLVSRLPVTQVRVRPVIGNIQLAGFAADFLSVSGFDLDGNRSVGFVQSNVNMPFQIIATILSRIHFLILHLLKVSFFL